MIMDCIRKNQIKNAFYSQLILSEKTLANYKNALKSYYMKEMLLKVCNEEEIFDIYDLEVLWKLYSIVNLHPYNISKHRIYSAAIMKYMRYLNGGNKYGRRIDYKKPRQKRISPD